MTRVFAALGWYYAFAHWLQLIGVWAGCFVIGGGDTRIPRRDPRRVTSPLAPRGWPPFLIVVLMPLVANGAMAGIIGFHMRGALSSRFWVGLGALVFFGLLPAVGLLLMVSADGFWFKRWWHRRKLRVLHPARDRPPR